MKKLFLRATFLIFIIVQGIAFSESEFIDISKEINELNTAFRDYNLKKSISKSQYVNLGLRLMKYPPSKGFITPRILSQYSNGDSSIATLNSAINKANKIIENISPADKAELVDSFHRDVGKRLLELESERKWVFNKLSHTMGHESEVATLNDGRVTPSNLSGSAQISELETTLKGRKFPWGQLYLNSGIGFTNYAEIKLQDRNKLDFKLNLGSIYHVSNKKMQFYLNNWVGLFENNDSSRIGLRITEPGVKVSFLANNPDPRVWSLLESKISFAAEFRDYSNIYAFDVDGQKKDSGAVLFAYGFNWGKRARFVTHNSYVNLHSILTKSDAQINDFILMGADFSHVYKLNEHPYKFGPKFSFKKYSNLSYLGQDRNDLNLRVDFNLIRTLASGKVELELNVAKEDNQSSHPLFEYDNTEFSAGLSCKW